MKRYRELPENISEKLQSIPGKPGVYQFIGEAKTVVYVGKAKNLRNRVMQYFQQGRIVDAKTNAMVGKIRDVEIFVTDSETEALLLENNLIKELKPRYNILLKDDKTYPYIRITNEPFPRVFSTRTVVRDGSKYFGPYTDGKYLSYLLSSIRSMFPLRSCDFPLNEDTISKQKYKACLDFHINKCEAPCEAKVSREHYSNHISHVISILNGKTRDVTSALSEQMEQLAENLQFEQAAAIRNRLRILTEYTAKQKVVSADNEDRDVVSLARDDSDAFVVIFNIREGKLIGKRQFHIGNSIYQNDGEILRQTMEKWYINADDAPSEILLEILPEDMGFLQEMLKEKKGKIVTFAVPQIGDKKKIVNLAKTNAEFLLRDLHLQRAGKEQALPRGVASLQRDLRLSRPPCRIECIDNSHIQGSDYVSSVVVFVDGKPRKNDYRKFKLKTVLRNDDFAAMREVVYRRYKRLIEEKLPLPDIILIDGGKGQLSSAVGVLTELELHPKIPAFGLAKRLEEIFVAGESESVLLPKTSTSLRLLQHIRDEAHRFAIEYHRLLRDKRTLRTSLADIPGIGEKTAQKLLVAFGSAEGVKNANISLLSQCVGNSVAQKIHNYFHGEEL